MSTEQAYINGFIKRASEHGLNDIEAYSLFKQANWKGKLWDAVARSHQKSPGLTGAALNGVPGLLGGGAIGGIIGGAKGLISPGEKVDTETGKTVNRSRLEGMLHSGGIGAGIGAGAGAGIGASLGFMHGRNMAHAAKLWQAEHEAAMLAKRMAHPRHCFEIKL